MRVTSQKCKYFVKLTGLTKNIRKEQEEKCGLFAKLEQTCGEL